MQKKRTLTTEEGEAYRRIVTLHRHIKKSVAKMPPTPRQCKYWMELRDAWKQMKAPAGMERVWEANTKMVENLAQVGKGCLGIAAKGNPILPLHVSLLLDENSTAVATAALTAWWDDKIIPPKYHLASLGIGLSKDLPSPP